MPEPTDPNAQTPPGNGQTDEYKTQFLDLSAKIANGEYVAKNVYTGLQNKHEKEVLAHKADVDALTAANAKVSELDGTLKTIQGQAEEFKTKFGTATVELETEKSKNTRLTLIMDKFPDLVSFEGKGLLPAASTPEELTTKLTSFMETIGARMQTQKKDQLAGASEQPAGKDNQQPAAASVLLQEALVLQKAGKYAEYNAKMNEYYKVSAAAK